VGHITALLAVSAEIHLQNVLYVGAITQPIIKAASTIISLYKETTRIEHPQHKPHLYLLSDTTNLLSDTTNLQHPTTNPKHPTLTPHKDVATLK